MSDTPRTDAVWERFRANTDGLLEPDVEFSTLARTLERELAEANHRIRTLIAERDAAKMLSDRKMFLRHELEKECGTEDVEQALRMIRGWKDRIKRLEEAGNRLLELCEATEGEHYLADEIEERCIAWTKAKEHKP